MQKYFKMKKILISWICMLSFFTAFSQAPEWTNVLSGSILNVISALGADPQGNVFITGTFRDTTDFDPGSGVYEMSVTTGDDIYICKYSATGALIWAKQILGVMSASPMDMIVDQQGSILICGSFAGTTDFDPGTNVHEVSSNGSNDIFILKLDNDGNFVWVKSYGSTDYDYAKSIKTDNQGNVYFLGKFGQTIDMDPSNTHLVLTSQGFDDILVAKLDAMGNTTWAKSVGGTGIDYCQSIILDNNNNIIFSGSFINTVDFDPSAATFSLSSDSTDGFLCKFTNNGSFVWTKQFSGSGEATFTHLLCTNVNEIFAIADFNGPATFDNNGQTLTYSSFGESDLMLFKFDQNGNYVLGKQLGGDNFDFVTGIIDDGLGNPIIAGNFYQTSTFATGDPMILLSSQNFSDGFMVRYTSSLDVDEVIQYGNNNGTLYSADFVENNTGNAFWSGCFCGQMGFNPNQPDSTYSSVTNCAIFFSKWGNITGINDLIYNDRIVVYPSPSNGIFKIVSDRSLTNSEIRIYSSDGALVYHKKTENFQSEDICLKGITGTFIIMVSDEYSSYYCKTTITE